MIQIKNAAELAQMRRACEISAAALKAGGEAIEPGISTAEIDKIIYDFIVRHGARPNFLHLYGFPATACISVNDTVIHGIPSRSQNPIQKTALFHASGSVMHENLRPLLFLYQLAGPVLRILSEHDLRRRIVFKSLHCQSSPLPFFFLL